ncbi:hypothetical protein QBC36DRAFT_289659 [Triangularia setosa]|uniref:Uncharacterized protein n=1 Tax=Triangularia setosa TaxID=2587417 RepID=A0AAN6W8F0_9PEZI|nr:hypothetical protein QBC36DRAFT_289659 [Podospora setosa]
MPSLGVCSLFALMAVVKICSAAVLPVVHEDEGPIVVTELAEGSPYEVVEIVEHVVDPFDHEQQHEVIEIVEIENASPTIEIIDHQVEVVEYAAEPRFMKNPSSAEAPGEEAPYEESTSGDSFDYAYKPVVVEVEEAELNEEYQNIGHTDWCFQTCQSFCARYVHGPETDFSFGDSIHALVEQGYNFKRCASTCIGVCPEAHQEAEAVIEIQDQIEEELAEVVAEQHGLSERLIIIEEDGDVWAEGAPLIARWDDHSSKLDPSDEGGLNFSKSRRAPVNSNIPTTSALAESRERYRGESISVQEGS